MRIRTYMFKAKSVGGGVRWGLHLGSSMKNKYIQWEIRIGIEFFVKHVLLLKQGV